MTQDIFHPQVGDRNLFPGEKHCQRQGQLYLLHLSFFSGASSFLTWIPTLSSSLSGASAHQGRQRSPVSLGTCRCILAGVPQLLEATPALLPQRQVRDTKPHPQHLQLHVSNEGGGWKKRESTAMAAAHCRHIFGSKEVKRGKTLQFFTAVEMQTHHLQNFLSPRCEIPTEALDQHYFLTFAPRHKLCSGNKNCLENYKMQSEDFFPNPSNDVCIYLEYNFFSFFPSSSHYLSGKICWIMGLSLLGLRGF